jgi:hypothetical protein
MRHVHFLQMKHASVLAIVAIIAWVFIAVIVRTWGRRSSASDISVQPRKPELILVSSNVYA